jgi:hypothetical protein
LIYFLTAENLLWYFGSETFDVIITTELLEHIMDWRLVINNMKMILICGGYISQLVLRAFHIMVILMILGYEIEDIRKIFRDFGIITLEKDHLAPGVFLKARKPENYVPTDLSGIALYSMILGRRTRNIPKIKDMAP